MVKLIGPEGITRPHMKAYLVLLIDTTPRRTFPLSGPGIEADTWRKLAVGIYSEPRPSVAGPYRVMPIMDAEADTYSDAADKVRAMMDLPAYTWTKPLLDIGGDEELPVGDPYRSPGKVVPLPLPRTEYNLVLKSGRVVPPGVGGFFWFDSGGRPLGGVHDLAHVISEMAAQNYGGVGVADKFGVAASITEFIPVASILTVVKR